MQNKYCSIAKWLRSIFIRCDMSVRIRLLQLIKYRDIGQFGSPLDLGSRRCEFESHYSDSQGDWRWHQNGLISRKTRVQIPPLLLSLVGLKVRTRASHALKDGFNSHTGYSYLDMKYNKEGMQLMEAKLRSLIKEAMLEKNKDKQITFKNILEGAQKIAKQTNVAVTDDMIIKSVKNEIKQLNDLKEFYKPEDDKYNTIVIKLSYCEAILPAMATEDDIKAYLINNSIEKNIGVCMKSLKTHFGANLDGRVAQEVVKTYINQ